MSGKGSVRRPQQVSRDEYERRWERAFGREAQVVERMRAGGQVMSMESWRDLVARRLDEEWARINGYEPVAHHAAEPQADGFPE